ncbi:hypothetical protein COV16_02130, partial [Candidatus Woesearchaeota archaeon CG10_big_fil_rev_8_21_14_0_10_34_8]
MSDDEQPTDLGARIEAIAGSYLEVARKRKGKDVMSTLDEAYDNFMRQVGVDYNTNVVQAEIKDPNTKADYLSLLDGILREYAQRDGTTKPRADKFNGWADSLVDRFNAEVAQYLTNVVEVEDDEVDDDQVTSPSGDGVTSAAPLNFDLPDDSDQAYSQPDVAVGTVPPPPDVPPSPLETELDPKTPEGAGIPDPSATDMFGIPDVASDTYDDAIEDTPAFSQNTTDFFQQGTQATDDDPIVGGRPISTFPKPNVSLGSDEPVIEDFEVDQTYVKAKKHRRRLGCGIATFVAGAVATAGILIGVYKSFNVGDFVSSYLSGSNGSNNTVQEEQAESADRLAEAADTGSPEATAPEPVVIPITITAPEQVVIPTITAPEPVSPPQPDYTEITLDSGYDVRYAQTPSGTIEAVDQTDLTVTYEVSSGLVGQTLRLRYDTND